MKVPGIGAIMGIMGAVQKGGVAALGPIMAETMPGIVRAAYQQRIAILIAERAGTVARLAGDITANALRQGGDIPVADLAALQAHSDSLRALLGMLPASTDVVTTGGLAVAYMPPGAARAGVARVGITADQVMTEPEGGL